MLKHRNTILNSHLIIFSNQDSTYSVSAGWLVKLPADINQSISRFLLPPWLCQFIVIMPHLRFKMSEKKNAPSALFSYLYSFGICRQLIALPSTTFLNLNHHEEKFKEIHTWQERRTRSYKSFFSFIFLPNVPVYFHNNLTLIFKITVIC